ncbi:hypothetical protein D3C80_1745710 [compost metagenome]
MAARVTGRLMRPAMVSRRAETANSRNRIRPQGMMICCTEPLVSTPRMAPVTRILSAMGSRMAPQRVSACQRRAR